MCAASNSSRSRIAAPSLLPRASGATYIRLISAVCSAVPAIDASPSISGMRRSAPHATARSSRRPTTTAPGAERDLIGIEPEVVVRRVVVPSGQLVVQAGDELDGFGVLERGPLDDERRRRTREPERVRRGAVPLEELQPALGVVDCRELAGPDPPQHDPGTSRHEPLAPAGEELGVDGSVGKVLERRDRRPDGHVHDDHRVGIRAECGRIALVGLESPHEAG